MKRKRKRPAEPPWQPFQTGAFGPPGARIESEPGFVGVFFNNLYQVTYREVESYLGLLAWLCIRRRDSAPGHDWRHLQRIKNELCGPEREALELYPAESRLVDTSNQYHLWVLPEGMRAPFGYDEREVSDVPFGKNKQRPFAEPPPDLNARVDELDPETGEPRALTRMRQ